ncbi:MAG TPA: M56 family metallopeptidase, partial [Pirellulales bacterium]
ASPANAPTAALPIEKTSAASFDALPTAAFLFAAAWLACSLIAWGRLLRGVLRSGRLMDLAEPCTAESVEKALQIARQRLGLADLSIEVLVSPGVRCPVIWCWGRRPRLLLPRDAVQRWSSADWTPILCHELAHWTRRDHLTALAAEFFCCLTPWQPLAWWAKRRLEHTSEQACDDWAVAAGHSAADYAETLLGLVAQPGPPLQLAALRRKSSLGSRVRHILTQRTPRPKLGRAWALAIVATTGAIIGLAAICQRGVAAIESEPKKPEPVPAAAQAESKADKAKPADPSTPPKPADDDKPAGSDKPADSDKPVKPSPESKAPAPKTRATLSDLFGAAKASPEMKGPSSKSPRVTGAFMPAAPGMAPRGSLKKEAANENKKETASGEIKRYTAAGRLVDPAGKPVAGAELIWEVRQGDSKEVWDQPPSPWAQGTSDADGRFSLSTELIVKDVHYTGLVIRAAGFGVRSFNIIPSKLDQPLEIQLDPSYDVEGSVFTPNGEPVKGAKVFITSVNRNSTAKDGSEKNWWHLMLTPTERKSGVFRKQWPAPVVTDENGQFRFPDLAPTPATVELIVEANDFAQTHVRVSHADSIHHPQDEDKNWRQPKFTLVLETPWLVEGRFIDEKTREGIPGVGIEVSPGTYGRGSHHIDNIYATSDAEGRYTLRAGSADFFRIEVQPPLGYPGINDSINATTLEKLANKGRKVKYEVKLRPGVVLRGKVVAEDTGAPVAGAEVIYRPESGRKLGANSEFTKVKSAADGSFELTGTDGKGFLLVDAPNQGFYRMTVGDKRAQRYERISYPHGMLEIDVAASEQTEPFVVPLKRGRELAVRALSPAGEPVKKLKSAHAEQEIDRFFSGREESDGVFRLNAAEPGRKYRLFLFSPDAMAGVVTEVEAPEDGHTIDVRLEPCATIRGRYVYQGGASAPDVSNFPHFQIEPGTGPDGDDIHNLPFYYNFAGHEGMKSKTDDQGAFELDGIVAGVPFYLSLNYKFDDGKKYRAMGELAPGEVKDIGDLVIQAR